MDTKILCQHHISKPILQHIKMDNESHPIWIIIKKQVYNKRVTQKLHEI